MALSCRVHRIDLVMDQGIGRGGIVGVDVEQADIAQQFACGLPDHAFQVRVGCACPGTTRLRSRRTQRESGQFICLNSTLANALEQACYGQIGTEDGMPSTPKWRATGGALVPIVRRIRLWL